MVRKPIKQGIYYIISLYGDTAGQMDRWRCSALHISILHNIYKECTITDGKVCTSYSCEMISFMIQIAFPLFQVVYCPC
jgi:hypothetical protein